MGEDTGDSPAVAPATVQRKAAVAVAIGAAAAGLLVGFAIALSVTLTTKQSAGGATAQTMTSTVTLPASTFAAPPTEPVAPPTTSTQQPATYSGPGAFAVGTQPTGGLTAAIPPGRYRAEVKPGAGIGSVMRCNDLLCGPSSNANNDLIAGTPLIEGGSTLVDIEPTDVAVYLISVTLTPID